MKKVLSAFFILFCLHGCSFASEIKFVHITDMNLNEKNAYQIQETIREINQYRDIDFVVFGGNNTKKASHLYLNTFADLLKKVDKKLYVLLGSNDVSASNGITKEYYLRKIRKSLFFKHPKELNYVFEKKDYVFIVMNGVKEYFRSPNGYYSRKELDWLEKTLSKYENKNKNVVILQHFPILETGSKWIETFKIDDYKKVLSRHANVKMIVAGHYDDNIELKQDGIFHVVTESYEKNGAYKIIELDFENGYIGTYLVK